MAGEKDLKTEESKNKQEAEKSPVVSVGKGDQKPKETNESTQEPDKGGKKTASDVRSTAEKKKKSKKIRRQILKGKAFVKSTYNNTIVSLTDMHGGLLAWSSAGLLGFKGAKKATTFAAAQVVNDVNEKVQKYGLKDIEVYVKGVGSGRESAIRTLAQKGFNLVMIKDQTPIPHNGCRPKKPRRV